jgi:predicted DsbA family dithiol-disulfide isomerase
MEFPIEDEWLAYELRPDTPPEGIPLSTLFPGVDIKKRYESLNKSAEPYGITFGELTRVSNSRVALQAGEYAKDHGKFHEFHDRVFRAYFHETLDIGNVDLIVEFAGEVGLYMADLRDALEKNRYERRLEEARELATTYAINAVPAFIIGEDQKIVGAQSLEIFRKRLRSSQ